MERYAREAACAGNWMEEAEPAEGLGEKLCPRGHSGPRTAERRLRGAGQPRARTCPSFLFSTALGSRQEHSSRMSQDIGKGITCAGHKRKTSVKALRFYAFSLVQMHGDYLQRKDSTRICSVLLSFGEQKKSENTGKFSLGYFPSSK